MKNGKKPTSSKARDRKRHSDLTVETNVLEPVSAAADLDDLARRITAEWRNATAAIIETGRLLIEAKKKVGHGNWMDFVRKLPFGDRTAQYLMTIAEHPVISNPKHASDLPPSWMTLHRLTELPDRELKEMLADGTINSETQRKDVDKLYERIRDEGLHRFERIPEALKTLIGFMTKYPDPKEIAGEVYINHIGEHAVDLSDVAKIPAWLTKLHYACEKESRKLSDFCDDEQAVWDKIISSQKPNRPVKDRRKHRTGRREKRGRKELIARKIR